MRSTQRQIVDDAPIAPDIVPAEWADNVPRPANDAVSREKLFAEIREAAETAAPSVDASFRATDVNDIPALKNKSSARTWIKRALTVFVFALISAFAAAAWKHHGGAATQALASLVPLPAASSSTATEPAADAAAEPGPADRQQADAAQPSTAAAPAAVVAAIPPETEQQIQSMARDLASMGQQIEQLKASIETLKASQQAAAAAPPPPVVRAPAPKPKAAAAPKPAPHHAATRSTYPPAMQAAAVPPPAPAASAPQPYPAQPYAPPQATIQPNGEPVVRPPMPMPLSDRY